MIILIFDIVDFSKLAFKKYRKNIGPCNKKKKERKKHVETRGEDKRKEENEWPAVGDRVPETRGEDKRAGAILKRWSTTFSRG